MKLDVHRRLQEIAAAQGKGYGKLVQKLLALAFLEAGVQRVTERSIQGIDLEVTLAGGERIAMEVKTSEPGAVGTVAFGKKDVQGLCARAEEGFVPYFAVLGNHQLDDWIFARHHTGEIPVNAALSPTRLRPYRDRALEALMKDTFADVVVRRAGLAADGGQSALDDVLRKHAAYRIA